MLKPYPRSTNYIVRDDGLIYSRYVGHPLNPAVGKRGYKVMQVRLPDGQYLQRYVHQVVAETFIPNPDNKPHINHIDGDKLNNRVDNLEWCTNAENRKHSVEIGTHSHGEKHTSAKLTEKDVISICERLQSGESTGKILENYPVTRGTLLNIRARRTWKHVSKNYRWDKKSTANTLSKGATTIPKGSTLK